jgi:hypothetical protein
MKPPRTLIVHSSLLVVAALASAYVWTREKAPSGTEDAAIATVWGGRPTDIQRIVYQGNGKKITLAARSAKNEEPWLFGTSEKDGPPVTPPPAASADAGADAAPPSPPPPAPKITTVFPSVALGNKLKESFAPLLAQRALGKMPIDRAVEFGLEKRDVSMTVTMAGKDHTLLLGSIAPGSSDWFALDPATNDLYVLKGDPLRDLEIADARMVEHSPHAWKDVEPSSVQITFHGKTRALVRGSEGGKKFWADPAAQDKADETAGNWMLKIDRIYVSDFMVDPPAKSTPVVRLDYLNGKAKIGYVDLVKTPSAEDPNRSDYWAASENTHLFGKIPQLLGEQIEQDVGTLMK